MPGDASCVGAEEEMYKNMALVGIVISMLGFISHQCTVMPIDYLSFRKKN